MYIPNPFEIEDRQKIANIIETYNFATLVTCEAGISNANHIPFLYDANQGDRVIFLWIEIFIERSPRFISKRRYFEGCI